VSVRRSIAKACISIAKKELERGWNKRGSKASEAEAIADLAKAGELLR
jgi:hypothetical protein